MLFPTSLLTPDTLFACLSVCLSSEATQDYDSCGLLIVPGPEIPTTRLLNLIRAVSQGARHCLDGPLLPQQQNSRQSANETASDGSTP